MNNNAIGVFDSGVGGLSVWRELCAELPEESLFYFADGANCPYGDKPAAELIGYIVSAVDTLVSEGAKMIVLACNTATAVAIDYLRDHYSIPFVGMEPAVKPAALSSKSKKIAVLATRASFKGSLYRTNVERYGNVVDIIPAVGEGFVEIVEQGREDDEQTIEQVKRVVEPLIGRGVDRIVLGCTHYPFLRRTIERVIDGRQVEIIDPAPAVARQAATLLDRFNLRAESGHQAEYRFFTAADDNYLEQVIDKAQEAVAEL